MSIKLIAIDVDGTLLDSTGYIQESSIAALLKAKQAGIKIVLATGRNYEETISYADQIGATDYFILFTGGLMIDYQKNILYKELFTYSDGVGALEIINAMSENVYVEIYTDRQLFVKNINCLKDSSLPDDYKAYIARDAVCVSEFEVQELAAEGIQKIFIISSFAESLAAIKDAISKSTDLQTVASLHNAVEILGPGAQKGNALRRLAEHLELNASEVAVIGDSDNDISMFREAGTSIAMGNSSEKARNEADYITADNDNNGISEAITYLLTI